MKYSTDLWCCGISFLVCCALINASNQSYCPPPDVPDNGKYEPKMNTSLPGSNVSYICNDGFVLDGSSIRECQFNGTWSQATPFCDREMRLKIVNATRENGYSALSAIDDSLGTGAGLGNCNTCFLQLDLEKEVGVDAVRIYFLGTSSGIEIQTGVGNNMTVCTRHNGTVAGFEWSKLKCDSYTIADKIQIRHEVPRMISEVQVLSKYDYGCTHPPEIEVSNGYFKVSRTKATLICEDGYTRENGRLDCEWNSWNDVGPRCVQANLQTFKNESKVKLETSKKTIRVAVIVVAVLIILILLGIIIYLIRKQRNKELDGHFKLSELSKASESRST